MKNQSILQSWDDSKYFEQRKKGIDPNRYVRPGIEKDEEND